MSGTTVITRPENVIVRGVCVIMVHRSAVKGSGVKGSKLLHNNMALVVAGQPLQKAIFCGIFCTCTQGGLYQGI